MIPVSLAFLRAVRAAALALVVASSACAGRDAAQTGAVVDTLPGGAVRMQSRAEGLWAIEESAPWQLVEELRIGRIDGEAPYIFGQIGRVIPDALGRIWVLDTQAYELRLFDAGGIHVRTVE